MRVNLPVSNGFHIHYHSLTSVPSQIIFRSIQPAHAREHTDGTDGQKKSWQLSRDSSVLSATPECPATRSNKGNG